MDLVDEMDNKTNLLADEVHRYHKVHDIQRIARGI